MTSIKQPLPTPEQPDLGQLEGKRMLSKKEREQLLDELLESENEFESPAVNSQAEPEDLIKSAQDG